MTEKKRWTHAGKWAEIFEEENGVNIPYQTIRKRLLERENEFEEVKKVRIKIGRISKFYSESDVREVCADLLKSEAEKIAYANKILSDYEITDRLSLFLKGISWFKSKEAQFPPHGGGVAFFASILGRPIANTHFRLAILEEVADKLKLPAFSEDFRQKLIGVFAIHGITDRQSLFAKGVEWFNKSKVNFSSYGGGTKFIGIIVGKTVNRVTPQILKDVADKIFPEKEEDFRQKFLDVLALHKIIDCISLFLKGVNWFNSKEAQFHPYGSGRKLIKAILGVPVGGVIKLEHLEAIADKLKLPEFSEDSRQKFLNAFAGHGIIDRQSLFAKGVEWFNSTEAKFVPFGGSYKFFKIIIGRSILRVSPIILKEVADKLGWK